MSRTVSDGAIVALRHLRRLLAEQGEQLSRRAEGPYEVKTYADWYCDVGGAARAYNELARERLADLLDELGLDEPL